MSPIQAPCESELFKSMMRRIASTVAIITANGKDGQVGITATSVASVSMSPPSLLVCVNQATRLHRAVLECREFRVNYLSRDQEDVALAFGGPFDGDRFGCGNWDLTSASGPRLSGCLGDMACTLSESTQFGTHSVFIGVVSSVNQTALPPLLYCNGGFALLSGDQAA